MQLFFFSRHEATLLAMASDLSVDHHFSFLFRAQREMKRGSVRPRIHPFVPESMELASVVDDETGA